MEKLRDVTLVFLIKRNNGAVSEICLAMKKRGFGVGKWNGVGGKVEKGEMIEEAAHREAREEIGIIMSKLDKVAELTFYFAHNPDWNQKVHTYFCEAWENEPTESEEMNPVWYKVAAIPYASMWPDDQFWLPHTLAGKCVNASFTFGENDTILEQNVVLVEKL